jgi:hypothetical protein
MEEFLGIVLEGKFHLLNQKSEASDEGPSICPHISLTDQSMVAAEDIRYLDVKEYEGKAVTVKGHLSGVHIYSAQVSDDPSAVLTCLVKQL